ncbi:MAG TPA: quinate 5-dehydrogenase, partial [Trueperaceae bacterium]|nr:quinate 5-dehydrogenase [Trueperaceae bacterium]
VEILRARGAKTLITTTPRFGSRSIGTNLLEAAFVAVEGASGELGKERYDQLIVEAGLRPAITEL